MPDIFSVLLICFYIYLILTAILLIMDNRESATTFAWLFVFMIFPVGGLIIYFLIGRNWRRKDKTKHTTSQLLETRLNNIISSTIKNQGISLKAIHETLKNPYKRKLLQLLYSNSDSILTTNNSVEIFNNGADKFEALKQDLKAAKKFIHMEYFIWRSDKLTQEIIEILNEKIKEGVQVRILYDTLGSFGARLGYFRSLRKMGMKIFSYYGYLSPITMHTLNYCNHRKIVVIDAQVAYTGGMNMGQEYVDGGRKYSFWRDTHVRIKGQAVAIFQGIFATDWYNTVKEDILTSDYLQIGEEKLDQAPIQITTSGPDSTWESIKQLYFMLITSAEEKIYIQSPYFIPDPSIYTALKTAALSGLDVRLMVTGVADKMMPYWAAFTYFEELLKAGVKVFHYNKGFMHAKTIVIDGQICSTGTANMDVRSFQLNYEVNALIYDTCVSQRLEKDFFEDLQSCEELTLEKYNRLSRFAKFRNSVARLFAPLL